MSRSELHGEGLGATGGAGGVREQGEQNEALSKRVPGARVAIIDIPAPCDFLNSNQRRVNPRIGAVSGDNRNGPGGAGHTNRSLTRSSGTSREGLT